MLDGPAAVMIARALARHALPIGQGLGFQVPATRSALSLLLRDQSRTVVDPNGVTLEFIFFPGIPMLP